MWAYNSIFYQIYPIGFCGAPVHNDGVCVPRIRKLMDWSEYLQTLGVDSILLNPIFESDNHGYDTRDFKTIDCRLGTNEDFKEVCEDLHKHNVKIVLDKLIEMHLTAMADAFRIQMDDPAMKEVPFEDRFGMLVDVEYSNRKNNRLKRLSLNSQMPASQRLITILDES